MRVRDCMLNSDNEVLVMSVYGTLRCFNRTSGDLVWTFEPGCGGERLSFSIGPDYGVTQSWAQKTLSFNSNDYPSAIGQTLAIEFKRVTGEIRFDYVSLEKQ